MRRTIALGVAGVALAASFAPLTSASASCTVTVEGHCYNACSPVGAVYGKADQAAGGKLPDLNCIE